MRTEYPVATLYEMALIPEEAWPRFLAELPHLLRLAKAAHNAFGELAQLEMERVNWVDDDEGVVRLTLSDGDDLLAGVTYDMRGQSA